MRKGFAYLLAILTMLLAACAVEPAPHTTGPVETAPLTVTEAPTETTLPAETETPATEAPPTEAPTEPETTEAQQELPYLQRIDRADQSIFEGPGYDYVFVGTVREKGTYTIVEERRDPEGNLWGRLKSGAGWVDLTQIRSEAYANALISANFADENLLLHGKYHHYAGEPAEYCTPISIRAYGTLRDLEICPFEFQGEDYVMGAPIFSLPELTEGKPLVAELPFPGDMSMYGIRFADENGAVHVYTIYISGRNGSLVLGTYAS